MSVTVERGYIKMTAASDTWKGSVEPVFYRWKGATAAAHACVLKDGQGLECYAGEADGANYLDIKAHPQPKHGSDIVNDLVLTTMESGVLEVHFRKIKPAA